MEAETRYAKTGDVHIAYRVFGDGPPDVVLVQAPCRTWSFYWELPATSIC